MLFRLKKHRSINMKDKILDFIAVLLMFACFYMLLLLGHGFDLLTLR